MIKGLVSICTPCYNHQKYLSDYFKSIIAQTYQEIELIIIDDCSNDRSRGIIEKNLPILERRFQRVVYMKHEENQGVTKTMNQMLSIAQGEWIKVLASDDMLLPDAIEKLVSYLKSNSEALIVIGNCARVPNNYQYGQPYVSQGVMNISKLSKIKNIHQKLLSGNVIACIGVLYTKKLLEKCGYYDPNIEYEDWDYFLTVSKTENLFFLDRIVCLYRESETSFGNYRKCESENEKRKRFLRIYNGGKHTLEKHTCELSSWERKKILKSFMLYNLYEANDVGLDSLKKMILKDMKQMGINTSKCFITCYSIIHYMKKKIKEWINWFLHRVKR